MFIICQVKRTQIVARFNGFNIISQWKELFHQKHIFHLVERKIYIFDENKIN